MFLDLEAHEAVLLALDHVCHCRSSSVPRDILAPDQHGSLYQTGRLSPGSASVSLGPWTSHLPAASPEASPCKWRQGQYHPPRTAALSLQKLGFVVKPCRTQRHFGYINESELSHHYLEIWDSGVILIFHKFIPKRKRLKKKTHLIKSQSHS